MSGVLPGLEGFAGFCFFPLHWFGGGGLWKHLSGLSFVVFGALKAMPLSDFFCTVKDEGLLHELVVVKRLQSLLSPGLKRLGFRVEGLGALRALGA